jgi:hypothetical protein
MIDGTSYTITDCEPEPPDAGPDWFPREWVLGSVDALNEREAFRKARENWPEAYSLGLRVET